MQRKTECDVFSPTLGKRFVKNKDYIKTILILLIEHKLTFLCNK